MAQNIPAPQKVFVPTPDPAQAARIAQLQRELAAKPHSGTPAKAPAPVASQPTSAPAMKPEDEAMLETLRCQKGWKGIREKFSSFVSSADLWQGFIGDAKDGSDTTAADEYSKWLASVEAYLKANAPRDFDQAQFENAKGNDFMKPPTYLTKGQAALWKEWQAKKTVLQDEAASLEFVRCD